MFSGADAVEERLVNKAYRKFSDKTNLIKLELSF